MATHRADSQTMVILNHLKTGAEINPLEAFNKYGVYRLGAVIYIPKKRRLSYLIPFGVFQEIEWKYGTLCSV